MKSYLEINLLILVSFGIFTGLRGLIGSGFSARFWLRFGQSLLASCLVLFMGVSGLPKSGRFQPINHSWSNFEGMSRVNEALISGQKTIQTQGLVFDGGFFRYFSGSTFSWVLVVIFSVIIAGLQLRRRRPSSQSSRLVASIRFSLYLASSNSTA